MKKYIVHFIEMLVGITFVCAGAAMGIIAALGQTTSTGTSWSIAGALGIKVGYGLIILYGFFMLLQMIALGRNFKITAFIQIVPVVLHGWILNFFKYDFPPFQALNPQTYGERFLIYAIGVVLISFGFTCTKNSNFSNYPPETFCALMSERAGIRFGTGKIIMDFFYVATSLVLCFLFKMDYGVVREGTLIFAVANGTLINLFQPYVEKLFGIIEKSCDIN